MTSGSFRLNADQALDEEFAADRLNRGYWPSAVASGCLGAFALITWAIFFVAQHKGNWTGSSEDLRQTFRVIGAFVAFSYVFLSMRYETFLRKHCLAWITLLLCMASAVLSSLIFFSFDLTPTHAFDRSVGGRMGTAVLIVTLLTYSVFNLPAWRIAFLYTPPSLCVVYYNWMDLEMGHVANVSFINSTIAVHLSGIVLHQYRKRQDFELFKQRKKTDQALHDLSVSEAREKEISAAKTRLIGSVSHDLRQPLNSLALYNNLLKSKFGGEQNTALNSIAERVQECVAAMEGNLTRLQDIAQLQARTIKVDLSPVSLRESIGLIQTVFEPIAQAVNVRLRIRSDLGADAFKTDFFLASQSERLFEILANLMSNAIKFSSLQGERSPWVLVRVRLLNDDGLPKAVRITIRDNGVGVAPSNHLRIFDEYVQLNNPERQSAKGYGLGLSVVRELVDSLPGHKLILQSRLGHGASFSLTIPVASQTQIEAAATERPLSNSSNNAVFNQHQDQHLHVSALTEASVVLVEDDESLRAALIAQLQDLGANVRAYPSAKHALAATANDVESPTCIISDYWLPEPFDGLQTINKLREHVGSNVPALLISAATDIDPARLQSVPNLEFAIKPVSANTLLSYVKKHHRLK